jgi:amidase
MDTPIEIEELTIADLSAGLKSGRWTSHKLVELYLARIDAMNHKGPNLGAIIELNPDALEIADRLDKSPATGPLHGIPILIKDNIDTADKMSTSAGSLALEHSHPTKDSAVAARLRAAGAVILGKTNLSEWANPSAAGAAAAAKPEIPTRSTATPPAPVPVPARQQQPASAPPP